MHSLKNVIKISKVKYQNVTRFAEVSLFVTVTDVFLSFFLDVAWKCSQRLKFIQYTSHNF